MISQRDAVLVLVFSFASTFLRADDALTAAKGVVNYSRDIRPVLSNHCFKCHGPDANERKSGLRLDVRENAMRGGDSGRAAIVPGKPDESQLVERIFSHDADQSMPPAAANKPLSQAQKELLRRWVQQGAEWRMHWSFESPQRPPLPKLEDKTWPRNPIDHFIMARLQAEGLKPSPEADQYSLIRRATLDLTGLPPTPAEIDAYLSDSSSVAYEKLIDRLLESPRYGERMALDWLDASRYADTHGFHIDSHRDMWKWREWVIEAFNQNLPFNRFTIEQLAGDLLPAATVSQKLASGFNRNHMINFEGGAIPEEYLTAYIVDRVNTTGTVWLGLSIGCAQCHDHKYEPITQKEYYQLYAFFNNVPENGLDGRKGNAAPFIKLHSAEQIQQGDRLASAIHQHEKILAAPMPEIDAGQAEWEKSALNQQDPKWTMLVPAELKSAGGATLTSQEDRSIKVSGANPATDTYTIAAPVELPEVTAIRLETLPDSTLKGHGPGRSENGNIVLTDLRATITSADTESPIPVKIKAATADFSQSAFAVANAIDSDRRTGWALHPEMGKPHAAVFEFEQPLRVALNSTLMITLDFQSQFGQHQLGMFRLAVTASPEPHGAGKLPPKVVEALAIEVDKRNEAQNKVLRDYYRSIHPIIKQFIQRLAAFKKSQTELEAAIPTSMVMQELDKPRDTFLLVRGQYDKKGDKVLAGVPASLPPLPAASPSNRLGLAQWLVDPTHPLTSRVMVNRYWQMCFGHGLVKTSEDFGSQGEWPSHPELLDWLATEFVSSGWDVKRLLRLMVTSAAYRQAAAVNGALLAKDPENRLLARSSRLRLQAEFIRDLALAASGLLNGQIGGPSVYPYQPPGLWEEMAFGKEFTAQAYTPSHGADLYRRSMYTFWKRTVPPATMSTFDAPDRETCTVRRARTNTPLQALVLMNDPTYVEAARKLAERLLTDIGSTPAAQVGPASRAGPGAARLAAPTPADRIALAYKLCLARRPTSSETAVLTQLLDRQLTVYRRDVAAAAKLLAVGESKRNEHLDTAELAAWTTLVSVILNLDETITRG